MRLLLYYIFQLALTACKIHLKLKGYNLLNKNLLEKKSNKSKHERKNNMSPLLVKETVI